MDVNITWKDKESNAIFVISGRMVHSLEPTAMAACRAHAQQHPSPQAGDHNLSSSGKALGLFRRKQWNRKPVSSNEGSRHKYQMCGSLLSWIHLSSPSSPSF